MKLTQQQALAVAAAAMVSLGECSASEAALELQNTTTAEKQEGHQFVQAVIAAAIAQGLVVEAAPIKPFVDLRSL